MMGTFLWIFILTMVSHIILAFIMSPPTYLANKFFEKFELHPKLREESVLSISVNNVEISEEDKKQFIQEFNKINFLFEGGIDRKYKDENPFLVHIKQGKTTYMFNVFNYGNQIEFIRYNKKKYRPYRAKSVQFQKILSSYCSSIRT